MQMIALSQDLFAVVDDADYEYLNQFVWTADVRKNTIYAYRKVGKETIHMHRLIMNPPNGLVVDHIDGNGLDNRRQNLRVITQMQNTQYANRPNKTSKYLGVYKVGNLWRARISVGPKRIQVGMFEDEIVAALAYNAAARELHGDSAILNEIEV